MKLTQVKKQPKGKKMTVFVDPGIEQNLANLKSEFEAGGFEWDFEKRLNKWLKNFVEEAGKAVRAQSGTTKIATAAQPSKDTGSEPPFDATKSS